MRIAILGAGMAGLSCAWLLQQQGIETVVLERNAQPGGIARSFQWNGFDCDFAAHRLFTRDEEVLNALLDMTPMLRHKRRSQIYFNSQWINDPLDVVQLFTHSSLPKGAAIIKSYLSRPQTTDDAETFEAFVVQKYGAELYDYFFRPYTEKLFGIKGGEISASWARAKVRLAGPLTKYKQATKTKFQHFYYPATNGYGAIIDSMYASLKDQVLLNATVTELKRRNGQISEVIYQRDGVSYSESVDMLISTLPLTATAKFLGIDINLSYQKVDAVYLHLNKPFASDNHWLYFMDDDISINRMVEFKNMSPHEKPEGTTVVCAEVTRQVDNPAQQVVDDLVKIGFIEPTDVLDTKVMREEYAYPVYRREYEETLANAMSQLEQYTNLHLVGRSAEFKHREVDDCFGSAVAKVKQILPLIEHDSAEFENVSEEDVIRQLFLQP